MMTNSSLVVVGSGIKFKSHLTIEAKAYIEQSDRVFYSVNEPAMRDWIQKSNPHAESLEDLCVKYPTHLQNYREITNYILESMQEDQHVCVVLYGHPIVFAQSALDAVVLAKQKGYYAKVLPGISAEDCLFADLLIDPGSCGCQSYGATDFLIHRRKFDPCSHLVLWQVGIIGSSDNSNGVRLLLNYLSQHYDLSHQVVLYEAAQYPCFEPRIEKFALKQLTEIQFTPISTLYVPPARKSPFDEAMLQALGIKLDDLKMKVDLSS